MQATFILSLLLAGAPLTPSWSYTARDRVIAVASNVTCVAVLSPSRVAVLDDGGKQLWTAELPNPAGPLVFAFAVSPACDWLAFATHGRAAVDIVSRDRLPAAFPLELGADVLPEERHDVKSLSMDSRGETLAIGSERGRLFLISSAGELVRTFKVNDTGLPVSVAFSQSSHDLVIEGAYVVGVMDRAGRWRWRRETEFASIEPSRDGGRYAAHFVPMHGPQGGMVGMLDEAGRPLWTRLVWTPSLAIAADGSFLAVGGSPMTDDREPDRPTRLWLFSPAGQELATATASGFVDGISRGCIVTRERPAGRDGLDAVGYDKSLSERWRIPWGDTGRLEYASGRILQVYNKGLRVYNLPACE